MKPLDPTEINNTAKEIEFKILETKRREESENKKIEAIRQQELKQLRRDGKKIREACKQFHSWATRHRIPPTWFEPRTHWWSLPKKGWDLDYYRSGITSSMKGEDVDVYTHLVILHGAFFRVEIGSVYSNYDLKTSPVQDDSELGNFSLEKIKKFIAKLVQQNGVPFK